MGKGIGDWEQGRVQDSGFRVQGSGGLRIADCGLRLAAIFIVILNSAVATELSPYSDQLSALAAKCDELGLADQAATTRAWIIVRYPGRQYLFLPPAIEAAAPKSSASETIKQWYKRFLELRREQAAVLFAEAKAASEQGRPGRAYQVLFEALREDPDHADARRILGF